MDYDKIKELLDKYLEGKSSSAEEAMLRTWFAEHKEVPEAFDWARQLFGYLQEKKNKPVRKTFLQRKYLLPVSIAAGMAILISIVILTRHTEISEIYRNDTPGILELAIDDQCRVWLNRETEITCSKRKHRDSRKLSITGEAYFEIDPASQSRYTILAANAKVRVDAKAAFNIKTGDDSHSTEIAVSKGSLRVGEATNKNGLVLLVGQDYYCSVHPSNKLVYSSAIKNNNYLAWKTGELSFNNEPLKTVTDALAEYYHVEITIGSRELALCSYSGSFRNQSLEAALKKIQSEKGLQITHTGKVFSLSGGDCKNN